MTNRTNRISGESKLKENALEPSRGNHLQIRIDYIQGCGIDGSHYVPETSLKKQKLNSALISSWNNISRKEKLIDVRNAIL